MCLCCAVGPETQGALGCRARVLALLALVEHSAGIPGDAALRIGQEILALVGAEPAIRRCEAVLPAGPVESGAVAVPVPLRGSSHHE
ncbi:MAG: hypothetical protein ACREFV_02965 [Acetobacteraceae bacterium]